MKQVLTVLAVVYIFFLLELALYNNFGAWGKPELLILAVVFFTLFLGIRLGIITAIFAGLLREGVGVVPLGMYLLIYLSVAYSITYVRRFLYQPGSRFSRAVMAFFGTTIAFIVHVILSSINHDYSLVELMVDVFAAQFITTVIAATFVFAHLKNLSEYLRLK